MCTGEGEKGWKYLSVNSQNVQRTVWLRRWVWTFGSEVSSTATEEARGGKKGQELETMDLFLSPQIPLQYLVLKGLYSRLLCVVLLSQPAHWSHHGLGGIFFVDTANLTPSDEWNSSCMAIAYICWARTVSFYCYLFYLNSDLNVAVARGCTKTCASSSFVLMFPINHSTGCKAFRGNFSEDSCCVEVT